MWVKVNVFAAWFLIAQIFLGNVISGIGAGLLGILGMPAPLHEQFGWLAGALMLVSVLFILRYALGELPPGVGKPGGKGYKLGHGLMLAGNVLALGVYGLPFVIQGMQSGSLQVILSMFAVESGYLAVGLFAVGVSLIYQSTLPPADKAKSMDPDSNE